MTFQQRLYRQQQRQALRVRHSLQSLQAHALRLPEATGAGAPQRAQMRTTAQRLAHVLTQGADVGAFAALHLNPQRVRGRLRGHFQHAQSVNRHIARRAFHLNARSGVFVQRLAVFLQGAVHGRHLPNCSGELAHHPFNIFHAHRHRSLAQHLALGIRRAGLYA